MSSKQQQTQKQSQKQEQALIQYYIYQDLQNLTNLIKSRKAVLDHFGYDVNHPMVILSNNKIILQLGISNGIHFDQQQQYSKDKTLTNFLIYERKKAYEMLKQVIDNRDNQFNKMDPLYQSLQQYKWTYENQKFELKEQYQLQPTNLDNKFDQNVLSKIISSIQTVDIDVNQINEYYPVPNVNEILQKANDYQTKTKQKLIENFGRDGKSNNLNGKNELKIKGDIEEERYSEGKQIITKLDLIDFLILQGYFNEEKIQYNCYNLVKGQFNDIKDYLIKYSKEYPTIKLARQLYGENKLENQFKLFFFFKLFMEYEKQLSQIKKIQAFNNSLATISKLDQSQEFFNYLQMLLPKDPNQEYPNLSEEKNIIYQFQVFCQRK